MQKTVWEETAGGHSARHDICIAAPTGSGKTLAYALPLVSALARERVHALRALVVLPTRDLAAQVFDVLRPLCKACGLRVGLVAGRASAMEEAALLAGAGPSEAQSSLSDGYGSPNSNALDILVITPGRLASHVGFTPGFTLRALRFLVVDECDRLLRQTYQNWLSACLLGTEDEGDGMKAGRLRPTSSTEQEPANNAHSSSSTTAPLSRIVKFIASATLTQDPAKLLRLRLHAPRFLAQTTEHAKRYVLPPALHELKHVVAAARKPKALAALLRWLSLRGDRTLVFASSVDSTSGVQRLLRALGPDVLGATSAEYSGRLAPEDRRSALASFSTGAARILVCSDAMTRGMDISGVTAVVNYDVPVYPKTYVHRAGRTARAGGQGAVYTLLQHVDVKHFKAMLRKVDNSRVRDLVMDRECLDAVAEPVARTLEVLKQGGDLSGDLELTMSKTKKKKSGNAAGFTVIKRRRLPNDIPAFSVFPSS